MQILWTSHISASASSLIIAFVIQAETSSFLSLHKQILTDHSNSMSGSTAISRIGQSADLDFHRAPNSRPIVIGLYGLPGSGKSYLLKQLQGIFKREQFTFYEGSDLIAEQLTDGLDGFHGLSGPDKEQARRNAISKVKKDCVDSGKAAVVAGHFMFWEEGKEDRSVVWTDDDRTTYTHIIYLKVPAEEIVKRRDGDQRKRPGASMDHLTQWQLAEETELRRICYANRILFSLVSSGQMTLNQVLKLLLHFKYHNEETNLSRAQIQLDKAISPDSAQLETMLVIDGDKTLVAEDTGKLLMEKLGLSQQNGGCPLSDVFRSPMKYSHAAFHQAALLYEEAANDLDFRKTCHEVATEVKVQAAFFSLLQTVKEQSHIGVIILTCGLQPIFEQVVDKANLSGKVKVIGGGRIGNGLVVTAAVKAALVTRLKDNGIHVVAYGDSPVDLGMLSRADRAIVVVGGEQTRSKSMDEKLDLAIIEDGLQAHQALLPSTVSPRLDTRKLPVVQLSDPAFVNDILKHRPRPPPLQIELATETSAAKLLATNMRNAEVAGPALRKAHRHVGWYLAVEYVTKLIGLEPAPIQHVQPTVQAVGFRLQDEKKTTIVALMRGGEPMASGVSNAFPLAMFVHASKPEDLKLHHLEGQVTVILVDSVINTGQSIADFVEHVRELHASIHIVVVAGVVQAKFAAGSVEASKQIARRTNIDFVALRTSDTSFKGTKSNDTGNRLFNTTHLD